MLIFIFAWEINRKNASGYENETSFELRAILSKIYKTLSTHLYTLVEYQNRNDILLNLFLEKSEHVQ